MKNILGIASLIIAVVGLLLFVFVFLNTSSLFIDGPPVILRLLIILLPVIGFSMAIISLFTEKNKIYPIIAIILLFPILIFLYSVSKVNF